MEKGLFFPSFRCGIGGIRCFIFLGWKMAQRVRLSRNTEVITADVCVDLGGVKVIMSQHLLKGTHINAILQHECSGRMAEFMRRILRAVQTGSRQMLFYELVYSGPRNTFSILMRDKQGVLVQQSHGVPFCKPVLKGPLTGLI